MPALYYIAAFVLAASLLQSAARVSDGERALSRLDTPEERTDTLVKGWMESLSLGLYTGASDKEQLPKIIKSGDITDRGFYSIHIMMNEAFQPSQPYLHIAFFTKEFF